jgi:hypothetical protein
VLFYFVVSISCHKGVSNSAAPGSLSPPSKLSIYIDYCDFGDYQGVPNSFGVRFFIINNTNDTLKYTNTGCLFSRFYCVDNTNMTVMDFPLPWDSIKRVVILPHRGKSVWVNFKMGKMPDTGFKFKIGMKLVQRYSGNARAILNIMVSEKQDTIWSGVKVVKTNGNHRISERTPEQYKEYILEKPLAPFFPPLIEGDRRKFTLSIDQSKIKRLTDTAIYTYTSKGVKKKYLFTICETKINNNSDDTLKYINMKCSWLEMYKVNNVNFSLAEQLCFGNYPEIYVVLPRQSSTVKIPVITDVATNLPEKIKIGLSLQKYTGDNQFFTLFDPRELMMKPETSNMIWSNEVTIH